MSPLWNAGKSLIQGFPRVSGDEPHAVFVVEMGGMFSPRERG